MAGCGEDDLHLPQEIICSEILTRLPVKSIFRFRSVCKSWHSLISCPNFEPKTERILLNSKDQCKVLSLNSHGVSFTESWNLSDDLPNRFRGQRIDLIGSCHGLICLCSITGDYRSEKEAIYSFIIYNPAIRKIVKLTSLSFAVRIPCYYGFGFDSKAGDYKVIYIYQVNYYTNYVGLMFDLRNGVWRKFTPIVPNLLRPWGHNEQEFYHNDAVYWRGWCETDNKRVEAIMSFNLGNEMFRVINMPAEEDTLIYRITTSRGLIYALLGNGLLDEGYSVWVMKEYGVAESWTKVFTIDVPCQFCYALILRGPEVAELLLLRYVPNGGGEYELILHNSETGESKCLLSTDEMFENLVLI